MIVWPAPGLSGALLTTRRGSCGWPRPRPVRRRRSVLILTAAPFSHVGTLVTFEVLVRRFVLDAVIPDSLGRLIHFLDVGGVPTPEAAGVKKHSCRAAGNHYGR